MTNNPLDLPGGNNSPQDTGTPAGQIIEIIFAIILITNVLVRDVFGFPRWQEIPMMSGMLLAASYLFANWWLTKPSITSARTVLITILYGFTSCVLVLAFVFKFLYLPGEAEMVIIGLVLVPVALLLDLLTSIGRVRVIEKRTAVRFAMMVVILLIYMGIGNENRIRFSYRNYPEFLQYYESQKDSQIFFHIEESYFER